MTSIYLFNKSCNINNSFDAGFKCDDLIMQNKSTLQYASGTNT